MQLRVVVILVLVQIALANINTTTTNLTTDANLTTKKVNNDTDKPKNISLTQLDELNTNNTRRKCRTIKKKKLKDRSTSSSSGEKVEEKSDAGNKESLELSGSSQSKTEDEVKPPNPNATGWRKWHRRCTPCLEDMMRKWRDPSISWICGAYQRARRSFKSECMMYYRNCQDGTMFIKIHEHRCSDADIPYHGKHFFYDYKVKLSDDDESKSKSSKKSDSGDDTVESRSSETFEDLLFRRDTQAKRTQEKKAGEKGKKKRSKKAKSQGAKNTSGGKNSV